MKTDLEKQFFSTFGIKPKPLFSTRNGYTDNAYLYPEITDHTLLELIRLCLNYDFVIHAKSKDELKEKLLALLIRNDVEFKQQVQALFKE